MKIVEVTLRFTSFKDDTAALLQDVTDLATELRAKDASFDVVSVDIADDDDDE